MNWHLKRLAALSIALWPAIAPAQTSADNVTALLNWAELAFPQYFPSAQSTRVQAPYTYRYYPETRNYLGVSGSGVWVLGPLAGSTDRPLYVGEVSAFSCGTKPETCADRIQLRVQVSPTASITPGLVADPDPAAIQDGGLNSSVVVQLTRNGLPAPGEQVAWSGSDPTGNVQYLSDRSDSQGLVRMWYLAGSSPSQRLTARHVGTNKIASIALKRTASPATTVGRYVSTYYDAPVGNYQGYSVSVVPLTAPTRTYYALSSIWRTDGSFAVYGGLQMTDCNDPGTSNPAVAVACLPSQGRNRGRLALFSSWDGVDPGSANTLRPRFVSAPASSTCQPFDHEGSGLQCMAALPWDIGEEWRWSVEVLAGAPAKYQRVRITASHHGRGIAQELATVDVPGTLNLRSVSAFNENWDGARSPGCLDVALRSMRIVAMGFWDGAQWFGPIRGIGMGGTYNETMTRCQNYGFASDAGGLTVSSGGLGLWVNLAETLALDPSTGRVIYTSQDQLLSQWQSIDVSRIRLPAGQ